MRNLIYTSVYILLGLCLTVTPACAHLETALQQQIKNSPQAQANDFVSAAFWGKMDIVENYLKNRININVYSSSGKTALMAASEKGQTEAVKLLLKRGAKANLYNTKNHRTALMEACAGGHTNVVKLLLDTPEGRASVRASSATGTTALMIASGFGHLKVVELLLNAGAAPEVQDKDGSTALIRASSNNKVEVAKTLMKFYETKKYWDHQRKLLFAKTKDGQTARDVTQSQTIIKAWLDAGNRLYRETHN